MKSHDVVGICNALVDILIQSSDKDLEELELRKGAMHLVDTDRQRIVLDHFQNRDQTIELGGSTMNVVRTLAALGKKTVFTGMIGHDDFGSRISERMSQLRIVPKLGRSQESTGSCVILVTPDGERTMNTHLGASRLYDERQIPHDEISSARILHFCGYQWDTEGQMRGIRQALDSARKASTLISFDVADPFVVERNGEAFRKLIKEDADIVFANREEATLLFGSPEDALNEIASSKAIAVIKLGAEGAMVRKGNEVHEIPPQSTQVIDTTAAGDMFAAGFLAGYLNGDDLPTCGRMAAFLAADVISRIGATVSDAALAEIPQLG